MVFEEKYVVPLVNKNKINSDPIFLIKYKILTDSDLVKFKLMSHFQILNWT